jgi:DNA-binding NarL/FixJ family response regulator
MNIGPRQDLGEIPGQAVRTHLIRVYLYSEQPLLASGMGTVITAEEGFQLRCFSSGLAELAKGLQSDPPDVLLLDAEPSGIMEAVGAVKSEVPGLKLVLWVNSISTEAAFQAMGAGVRGILRKNLAVHLQIQCLREVQQGGLWYEKALTDGFLAAKRIALSRREGQLMVLLSQGLKNKEIGDALRLTVGTVKIYISRLLHKAGAQDRFELALCGLRNLANQPFDRQDSADGSDEIPGLRSLMIEKRWTVAPLAKAEA